MKLSTLMLADHAEIREARLSVLSGFVNILWRSEFPSPLKVYLVAAVEATPEDFRVGKVESKIEFWCDSSGLEEPLFRGEGVLESNLEDKRGAYFPIVFDVSNGVIPRVGEYVIHFSINDVEVGTYTFYVESPS